MRKIKDEKGAITLVALVSILFMISFLISSYVLVSNKLKTQKEMLNETRKIYEPNQSLEEIYNSYFAGTSSILPKEYQQVEYIESTGTQYINTQYIANSNSKFITTASFSVVGNYNFENGSYDGNRLEFCAIYLGKWLFGLGKQYISVGNADTEKHTFYMDMDGLCKVDNDEYRISDSNPLSTKSNYLFAANFNNSTSAFCRIKIYLSEFYENEMCMRSFIPCYRKSDNEVGLYDLVGGDFYINEGSGDFIAGPVVKDNNIIPINTVDQLFAIGTGEQIAINGKIYTFSDNATYVLKNDLEFSAIDLDFQNEWMRIDYDPSFLGNFEWNGHTINVTTLDGKLISYNKQIPFTYETSIQGLPQAVTALSYEDLTGTNLEKIRIAVDEGKVQAVLQEENLIAVVPTGFEVSTVSGENTISGGLVIRDGANEYVWIPYTSNSTYTENQILEFQSTDSTTGCIWDSQEELDYYYDKDFYDYENEFTYTEDKIAIESSINKYKGFYVGRYETTIDNGVIGTMPNKAVIVANTVLSQTNNKQCRWWGFYKIQKDMYADDEAVFSTMITSGEWNVIMSFTGYGNAVRTTDTYTTKPAPSGTAYKDSNPQEYDVSKNIYDLAGNLTEYTLNGLEGGYRIRRGRLLV